MPAEASLKFNGTSQSASSAASVTFGVNIITVCFRLWWDTNATDDKEAVELSSNYNNNDHTFLIDPNASGSRFRACIQDSVTTTKYRCESIPQPSAAGWHTYEVTFDNSTNTGNVDIALDGTNQTTTIDTNTKDQSGNFAATTLFLMARNNASAWGAGRMADFVIYKVALSAAEILAYHNAQKYGALQIEPSNILLYLPMDETADQGSASGASSIKDRTSNGNNFTPTGTPTGLAEEVKSYQI